MATTKAISAALKLVDGKKENLRKAFEDLQSHSSSLSSFTLTWSDLDSYFTSLQSSLEHKFKLLQSLESQPQPSKSPPAKLHPSPSPAAVPARPKLIEYCEKMDGMGLRLYMVLRIKELTEIKAELSHALMRAPNAAALVLSAMEGFFPKNRDFEMGPIRSCCLTLLEQLMELKPAIGTEVKEKAKKVAVEWRKNLCLDGENPTEELGFLELVAAYGLKDSFNMDELINCLVIVSKRRQAFTLCKVLNIALPEFIQRLISKGNQLLAVKFIFEFAMADKFPPVPLLKEYLKGINDLVNEMRNSGKLNDAKMKEKSALKSVIKCIEDYKLDSEYPKDTLIQCIEKIDKEKEEKKRSAAASPAAKPQQQQSTSKRARTNEQSGSVATTSVAANSAVPPTPTQQPQGLLPHHPAPPAVPYSLPDSNRDVAPLTVTINGPYGWQGAPIVISGNPTPNGYPAETQMPAGGYYGTPPGFGGYALPPQYHPSYYPQ